MSTVAITNDDFNPFYSWVPKGLGVLILIFLFFPILSIGGVYTANSGLMTSGLGIISEHITFASYCTNIGMAAFAPLFVKMMLIRREKLMCVFGFSVMFVLSYVCAKTDSVFVLAVSSIIMGFLRMLLMLCNIFVFFSYVGNIDPCDMLKPGTEPTDHEGWFKTTQSRNWAYLAIYWFFMLMGQCGTALTAWLASNYQWQDVYYFMMGLTLVAILIIFLTMPYKGYGYRKRQFRFPYPKRMFGNITLFCIAMSSFAYVMVYGKTYDWFDDPSIKITAFVCVISLALMIPMERRGMNVPEYLQLYIFRLKSVRRGLIFYTILMALNCSALFVVLYSSIGMKLDTLQSANLNNWTMMGYTIGGIICAILYVKKVPFRWIITIGFVFMAIYSGYMYFEVQSSGLYERMKWPIILRSISMMIVYISIPSYATHRMPLRFYGTWVCLMLAFRMVIGPAIGTAVYANVLQYEQQYYTDRYAENVDNINYIASQQYNRTAMGMVYQGKSTTEAQQMASISTKGTIQIQANLSAVKKMSGWTLYASLLSALFAFIFIRGSNNNFKTKEELLQAKNKTFFQLKEST